MSEALLKCASCGFGYDMTYPDCPNCSFPNMSLKAPAIVELAVSMDAALYRALRNLSESSKRSMDDLTIEAIERLISSENRDKHAKKA
jgi:hypothetical protein